MDPPKHNVIAALQGGERFVTLAKKFDQAKTSGKFIPDLLSFEAEHQGALVGLMALRKIFRHARQTGLPNHSLRDGKREALRRLNAYVHLPECAEAIQFLSSGGYCEPFVEVCLRAISTSKEGLPSVRAAAQYHLASWMLGRRHFVESADSIEARIERLEESKKPDSTFLAKLLRFELAATPDTETFARWEDEAREMLRSLKASGNDWHKTEVKNLDPRYHVVQLDAEKTNEAPSYSELAAALLLKDTHLRKGAMAQDLIVSLVTGEKWNLREQQGKVVVIQFSFTGCFPCKKMYPALAELVREHGDSISVLTVMRDDQLATTKATIESDKMTWNVCWDENAKLATQWAVRSFPTVYILGKDGRIATTRQAEGKAVKSSVEKLLR